MSDVGGATPEFERFVASARAFLDANADPRRVGGDRARFRWGVGPDRVALFPDMSPDEERAFVASAKAWRRRVFDAGFGWISGPHAYGGRDLPRAFERAYYDLERRYRVPSRAPFTIGLGMVAPTILAHGTSAARERWLRALHRADAIGCQLFSEPDAGSDLAGVATAAVPDGHRWRLTGQKVWTSGAHFSDVGLILARTSPGPRHRNLTAFLVEMVQPGVEVRPLRQMTGGASFNEVFLDGAVVTDDHRLGDVDGGWAVAMTTLAHERDAVGGPGAGGAGVLSTDRLIAMLRASGRAGDPVVRQEAAALYADLAVARVTRARALARRRAGLPPGPEGSIGKLALTRNLQRLAELAGHALGVRLVTDGGEWGTYAWAELVLGVPGMRLGGGTDEVQRTVIAERVLGLPKDAGEP